MLDAIARARPGSPRRPARRLVGAAACARRRSARPRPSRSRPFERERAVRLLGLDPDTVHCLPNGVDIDRFTPYRPSDEVRRGAWLRWLVQDAQGWDEASREPGQRPRTTSARCSTRSSTPRAALPRPVLMFVGRFLGFKRVPAPDPRLRPRARPGWRCRPRSSSGAACPASGRESIRTPSPRARASTGSSSPAGAATTTCRSASAAPTAFVAPSTDEPFGLVYLEAMACELPVIGTTSGGPPSFVNVVAGEPDGWLVPPDDEAALTAAMVDGDRGCGGARTPRRERGPPCPRAALLAQHRRPPRRDLRRVLQREPGARRVERGVRRSPPRLSA